MARLRIDATKSGDLFPEPRIAVGRWLRQKGIASACIDISDGLSTDLSHVCEESGVGAVIVADAIPVFRENPRMRESAENPPAFAKKRALGLALHGGEDYELLFTAPRSKDVPNKISGVGTTRIGEIVRGKLMQIISGGKIMPIEALGWEHFQRRSR